MSGVSVCLSVRLSHRPHAGIECKLISGFRHRVAQLGILVFLDKISYLDHS